MVHLIVAAQQKIRHGDDAVAVLQQVFEDRRQRLGRVLCRVVEQHDAAGLYAGADPLGDLARGKVLPVQAVPDGNSFKPGVLLHGDGLIEFLRVKKR